MKNTFLYLLIFILSSCAVFNPNPNRKNPVDLELKPFTTDYCSEWPDGGKTDPMLWAGCCFKHDIHYWVGGTESEREKADLELRQCVKLSSDALNGIFMYMGVRMGGKPGDASYAWGYGWTQNREYFSLTKEEALKAKSLLENYDYKKSEKEKKLIKTYIEQSLNPKILD